MTELEPVAWTQTSQLDLVKELGNDVSGQMWGKRDIQEVRDFYGDTIDHIPDDIPLVTLSSAQSAIAERDARIAELEAEVGNFERLDVATREELHKWQQKAIDLCARAEAAEALLKEAGKVLEPFAKKVRQADERASEGGYALSFDEYECNWAFTFGHLRAARSLASKIGGGE